MSKLLKALCSVTSPSGDEENMKHFIVDYVGKNAGDWQVKPKILHGEAFQDCLILVFGNPKVAAFAHMDTIGFTVRYQDQLIPIGGPEVSGGEILIGHDEYGEIECELKANNAGQLYYDFGRAIISGTNLVYKPAFADDGDTYISPYLDNRVGIYTLLKLAETMKRGALVFSTWEEHGGGSVPFLVKYLYEEFKINKMLVSDVTWVSDGIHHEEGVVISYRDQNIPRKSFLKAILSLAKSHNIPYQIEVEAAGSSDGREIQSSPFPIDWCFVGPAISSMHSDHEKISKADLNSAIDFYRVLVENI